MHDFTEVFTACRQNNEEFDFQLAELFQITQINP